MSSEIITRVASLNTSYLNLMKFSEFFINQTEEYLMLYGELEGMISLLEEQLFNVIRKENGDKKIIKIKRKVSKKKYIETYELEYFKHKVNVEDIELERYNSLILKLHSLSKYCYENFDHEYITVKKNLKNILDNNFFYNGLILSSKSIRQNLKKYQKSKKYSAEKLDSTYINYLYRTILKPSPFGAFTVIGLSTEKSQKNKIEVSNEEVIVDIRINYIIFKMILESLLKRKYFRLSLFVSEAEIISINKDNIKLMIEKNQYDEAKYQERIVQVKNNYFLSNILRLFEDGPIKYTDALIGINRIMNDNQGEKNLEKLLADGIIELRLPFNNSDPDLLIKWIEFLQSNEKLLSENSSILNQLLEIESVLQKMKNIGDVRRSDYINRIENIVESIYSELNIEHTMKNVIYEDYYFKETLNDNNKNIRTSNLQTLELINKLCLLFDKKNNIRIWAKDLYLNYFKENKNVNIIDFFSVYNRYLRSFNQQETSKKKLEFNPFNSQEIKDLTVLRQQFIETVLRSEEKNQIIQLKSKSIEHLGYKIESITGSIKNSRAYYIQHIGNDKIIVNNILDGSGHYITRFMNAKSNLTWQEKTFNKMKEKKGENTIELLNSSYFNANVHYPLSNFGIGYRQSVNNLVSQINFKDLTIKYCEKENNLYIYSEYYKKKFNIYDLGFLTEEMKPALYNFLSIFNQNSNLSPEIFLNKYEDLNEGIFFMPRLVIDEVVLSRKKWSFKKEIIKTYLNKENFLELLLFFERKGIPKQFFFKYYNEKWSKPKYIDLYSPISFLAFLRETKNLDEGTLMRINETLPEPQEIIGSVKESIFEV